MDEEKEFGVSGCWALVLAAFLIVCVVYFVAHATLWAARGF